MHRHFRHHHPFHSRHGWGGHMGGPRGRGRAGRLFEHGDLRWAILGLLEAQPRHGYELIKALEDGSGGAYRPSAGVIYPTLSLLEDEGLIRAADGDTSRKRFELTQGGREALEKVRTQVEGIFARMQEAAAGSENSRPRVQRAMHNLRMALRSRLSQPLSPEQLDRLVAMLDDTAATLEKI